MPTPPLGAPLVTVGISFFNEERHLAAAIRSVLDQTMRDFELILIDDGSTDRSLAIARGFRDARITIFSDGTRRRLPARLNEIVRRARGDFVARMDADDVSHPDRLERQLAIMREDPTCDVVGTWAGLVDESGEPFAVIEAGPLPASPRQALEHGVLPHATMLARRAWLARHPYDESLSRAEDRDLWCRTAADTHFAIVQVPLYVVRIHARGADFLPDYLESHRQNRTLFLRYGPRLVGAQATARAWLASHGKSLVMRAAVRAGVADRIVRRRGRPPTTAERAQILEALKEFRA